MYKLPQYCLTECKKKERMCIVDYKEWEGHDTSKDNSPIEQNLVNSTFEGPEKSFLNYEEPL
jgi:hypothetical protein